MGWVSTTGRVGVRVFEFAQPDQKFGTEGGLVVEAHSCARESEEGEEPKQSCEEMTRGCDGDWYMGLAGAGL